RTSRPTRGVVRRSPAPAWPHHPRIRQQAIRSASRSEARRSPAAGRGPRTPSIPRPARRSGAQVVRTRGSARASLESRQDAGSRSLPLRTLCTNEHYQADIAEEVKTEVQCAREEKSRKQNGDLTERKQSPDQHNVIRLFDSQANLPSKEWTMINDPRITDLTVYPNPRQLSTTPCLSRPSL